MDELPDELELLPLPDDDFDDDDDDLLDAAEASAASPDLLGSNFTFDDPDLLPPARKMS